MNGVNTIDLRDLSMVEKKNALTGLAQRWTDLLFALNTPPRALGWDTDVTLLTHAVAPLCSPLHTIEFLSGQMYLLHHDVQRLDRYSLEGTWEAGEDDILGAMEPSQRLEFLTMNMLRTVFGLIVGTDPCVSCMRDKAFEDWSAQTNALRIAPYRCKACGDADEDEFRAVRNALRVVR